MLQSSFLPQKSHNSKCLLIIWSCNKRVTFNAIHSSWNSVNRSHSFWKAILLHDVTNMLLELQTSLTSYLLPDLLLSARKVKVKWNTECLKVIFPENLKFGSFISLLYSPHIALQFISVRLSRCWIYRKIFLLFLSSIWILCLPSLNWRADCSLLWWVSISDH